MRTFYTASALAILAPSVMSAQTPAGSGSASPDVITRVLSDATFIAGIITAIVALGTFTWQRWTDVKALRNALFAELRHIWQHYQLAGSELRLSQTNRELEKRLKWSKFGQLITIKDLPRFAILGATEMQRLLQISFVIRNTDQLIDMLLKEDTAIEEADLAEIEYRMRDIRGSANALIEYMKQKDPRFSTVQEPRPGEFADCA